MADAAPLIDAGVYEFTFGARADERDALLEFWLRLGFTVTAEGRLGADEAAGLYGHASSVQTLRLDHAGCASYGTGYVRLQCWDRPLNDGLGDALPLDVGSRWMGMYTRDILELRDSFQGEQALGRADYDVSPLVSAPLAKPPPAVSLAEPFVGLREMLVFGERFRLAFIQRGGFDRPGFGTFDETIPFKTTEGSHANIVQPIGAFSTDFYKTVFGFETAPFGEEHDSGDEPSTKIALRLAPGQLFRVERLRAPDCPTGLLQVYSPHSDSADVRERSRPGARNLSHYSLKVRDLAECRRRIEAVPDAGVVGAGSDEFGAEALTFRAPDGAVWVAVANAG
ncbi:MAG: hypothetical protein AAFX58_01745 [Pseudomonadota bacterium]